MSRTCGAALCPHHEPSRVPIGHITNGVHFPRSWRRRCARSTTLPARWLGAAHGVTPRRGRGGRRGSWRFVEDHQMLKAKMIDFVAPSRGSADRAGCGRARARSRPARALTRTSSPSGSRAASPPTSAPTCCSTTSIASSACSLDADRPIQLVFAGKAHPQDDAGKRSSSASSTSRPDPAFKGASCSSPTTTWTSRATCSRAWTCG